METEISPLKKFLKFDKVASIIGFVVDTITIISILFTLRLPKSEDVSIPTFITPWLALGIWFISFYVYLSILHSYWEKHQEKMNYHLRFHKFLMLNLTIQFRQPFLLLPGIVLFILLLFIIFQESLIALGIIFVIVLIVSAITYITTYGFEMEETKEETENNWIMIKINDEWDQLEKRITLELGRNRWIDPYDLADIARIWQIRIEHLDFAMAKYATQHPDKSKYGFVCESGTGKVISGQKPVLINMVDFPTNKFYASSL